jgi:NAD(P)-dependent dehydrogenase (short-subunit alcohol dehydrogenase family)
MKLDFSDQVVIVTGAAGNLGSAVALAFRSLGARLALVERQEQLLEEAFPELMDDPDCLMNGRADLTNPEDVQAMVDQAMERFGRVDVLANTVGGYRAGPPVHETELNTWDFMLTLNAKVAFLTSRAVIPVMLSQGRGKIVHIGARPGLRGSAGAAAYSASKAAVIRLTESAAAEYRKQGTQHQLHSAGHHRHGREPREHARRRLQQVGSARVAGRRDPPSLLRSGSRHQRGGCARLRFDLRGCAQPNPRSGGRPGRGYNGSIEQQ